MQKRFLTVTELTSHIKSVLERDTLLEGLTVSGELSNYKVYPSGHHYFSLKDADSSLRCVMFRNNAQRLRFRPENGMQVAVSGKIAVYPRDGAYQLYAVSIIPTGMGDLYAAFEQLKEHLSREGLFDAAHKKQLPRFPKKIAVITSSAGAALRDILRILNARWPAGEVVLLPVRVQGVEAPAEIAGAIRYANLWHVADLIITGRGGGSMEDLWAFNDERVARAIFDSEIPVISAVGHEPDFTISDFVADLRAATPSNAAELAVPDQFELREQIFQTSRRLSGAISQRIRQQRALLYAYAQRRVLTDPSGYLLLKRMDLDHVQKTLAHAFYSVVSADRRNLAELAAGLDAMSPLKVLGRGYSVATASPSGKAIRSIEEVETGDRILVRVTDGSLDCTVNTKEIHHG